MTDWLTIPIADLPKAIPRHLREKIGLTDRLLQVLQLVALGKQAKEIGPILGISYRTIEVMRQQIRQRMGIANTALLIIAADRVFREMQPCHCQQQKPPKPGAMPASSPATPSSCSR